MSSFSVGIAIKEKEVSTEEFLTENIYILV